MAKCDQGYLCEVCGEEVEEMTESDLYLRFVVGQIGIDQLQRSPERHIRCNPVQAQFIVAENFEPVTVEGPFGKCELDPDDVCKQEDLITRGWCRLQEVTRLGLAISEYPLEEIRSKRTFKPTPNDVA